MVYSLVHLLLLLAATLGVWVARPRIVALIIGLALFPLPAALYNYYAAPIPAIATSLTDSAGKNDTTVSANDCAREPQPPVKSGASDLDREADRTDVNTDCAPRKGSTSKQILVAVIMVNYLTVLVGFVAGVLCRAMVPSAPVRQAPARADATPGPRDIRQTR